MVVAMERRIDMAGSRFLAMLLSIPVFPGSLRLLGGHAEYITTGTAPRPGSRNRPNTDLDTSSVHHLCVRQYGGFEMVVGVAAGARRHASQRSAESIML